MLNFKKLLFLLSNQDRKKAAFLLILIFIMGLLDMLGVASILPFVTVLMNPDIIEVNYILSKFFKFSYIFGIETSRQFLIFLGLLVFLLLIISQVFKALTTYVQARFVKMCEFTISKSLIAGYLNQPYSWFLNRNSSELGKNILSEVSHVVESGIRIFIELIAKIIIAAAIMILLIFVDFKLAFLISSTLGGIYVIIFYLVRNYLNKTGEERMKSNQKRFEIVIEAFNASKEVKFLGLEESYVLNFSKFAKVYAKNQAYAQVVSQIPRFILEAIAFGGILLITLYMLALKSSLVNVLPIISLYVFAGYRLMPALQQIYSSFTLLTFIQAALDKLINDIKNLKPINKVVDESTFFLKKEITLKNISYSYPDSLRTSLQNINIVIPAKKTVGLVGITGCGKTTTVDIILGLLEPQIGTLEVDGRVIARNNVRSWQRSIGYVPQNIYLADKNIAENIAFGVNPSNINQIAIEKASKIANIHDFIINELPKKYETIVGERGVRLSGGQRQRIGIARALYNNPQVLIFDEATSALDNETEKAVMDAINRLSNETTIILIAHRLNTIKNCDIVYKLEKGKLVNKEVFTK